MLAHRLRHWPNIRPVLSYWGWCLVSHWRWATVTDGGPTSTQLWFKASLWYSLSYTSPPLTGNMSSTGDTGPAFNRHWIGVSLYSVDTPPPTGSTVQGWMVDGQSRRRWTSVKPALVWRIVFAGHCVVCELAADRGPISYPANTGYSHNAVSMLAHRLRRWPNIETTLGEWPVFAGISYQPFSCRRADISSFCLEKKQWIF